MPEYKVNVWKTNINGRGGAGVGDFGMRITASDYREAVRLALDRVFRERADLHEAEFLTADVIGPDTGGLYLSALTVATANPAVRVGPVEPEEEIHDA